MANIKQSLAEIMAEWGTYSFKDSTIILSDNIHLANKEFLQMCKDHQIRILPNLFTPIP